MRTELICSREMLSFIEVNGCRRYFIFIKVCWDLIGLSGVMKFGIKYRRMSDVFFGRDSVTSLSTVLHILKRRIHLRR